ncbi:hypothetical protein, partial [uncultured Phocaeicola sp.]
VPNIQMNNCNTYIELTLNKSKGREMKSSRANQNFRTAAFSFISDPITTFSNSGSNCSAPH